MPDTTDRRRSTSGCEDIYHAIFKHFLDGIIGINKLGIIQAINPAAEKIFGYLAAEVVGKNISIFMPEPYCSEHDTYLKRYCDGGLAHIVGSSRQVLGKRKDGSVFPMELAVTEAKENNRHVFLGSIRDLSTEIYYETSLHEAEEQLRQSQEYAGVAHWHYNILTKQLDCSENFLKIHGLAKNSARSFYLETLLYHTYPDDKHLLSDAFVRCLAGINQGEIEIEYRIVNAKGNVQWVLLKGGVEKNNEGDAIVIHGVVQNTTKRKNAESKGVALGEIIDKAQIEIYIINMSTFKFIEVNKLARDNLGYSLDELKLLTPLDINKGLTAEDFYEILAPIYSSNQESVLFQSEYLRRDCSTYPVEVKLQFMFYSGQDVCIAFAENISDRLSIMKDLHNVSQAKSQFLSRMSHELRTPLNAILGFSQLMVLDEETPLSRDQAESVAEIHRAGEHLLNLINEVLDLSKIEAGQVSISLEPIEIKGLAKTVQQLIEPIASKYRIKFINNIDRELYLMADPTRCKQILINLISNAIKYNKENGAVTLGSKVVNNNQFLRVEIKDTGHGLSPLQIERLFIPFERLGAEITNIEGTGIGLTLTKELVQLMGGELGVDSTEGVGSCFWFTLPLESKQPYSSYHKTKATNSNNRSSPSTVMEKKSVVLYIEDNLANLKFIEKVIKKHLKHKFIGVSDVETGIMMAKKYKPDIILMDIHLPGINGIDGKKLFGADIELQHIPIIALSASAMSNDIKKAMAVGFNRYLTKPVNIQELKDTINLFLPPISTVQQINKFNGQLYP